MNKRTPTAAQTAVGVFALAFVTLLAFHGNRLVLTNDEGILLEPAQRMAEGARPYADFFGYMSPGSYWLQSVVFRLFGISLRAARIMPVLDFSLPCALLYWLVARLASARAAVAGLVIFAGFQLADPALLTAQHRWDSSALALAGISVALRADVPGTTGWWWGASGALLAAAAWCTPSILLVAVALGLWLLLDPARRGALAPVAAGMLAVSAGAMAWLFGHGCLGAFLRQLAWLRQNYAGINVMPYGSVIGGYGNLMHGAPGPFEFGARALLVACFALPAILPPAAALAWIAALATGRVPLAERRTVWLLLLALISMVAATFPRADVTHLAFVAVLPYALAAAALARFTPCPAAASVAGTAIILSGMFASNNVISWSKSMKLTTPAGIVLADSARRSEIESVLQSVRPGQTLFVYPYMPLYYFVTQAKNPTRYCYLQPGMMTGADALEALAELQSHPPQWLLYMRLSREEFERTFPFASKVTLRFEDLENWLERNYQPVGDPGVEAAGYQLRRRAALTQSAGLN